MTPHQKNQLILALDDMIEEASDNVFTPVDTWLEHHEDDLTLRQERVEECRNLLATLRSGLI